MEKKFNSPKQILICKEFLPLADPSVVDVLLEERKKMDVEVG